MALIGSYGTVVLHRRRLHTLNKSSLEVTGLRRLARRIDETLAATHRVEEELLRAETAKIRVLHKTARFGSQIILREVR